jgi:hypothetical protein
MRDLVLGDKEWTWCEARVRGLVLGNKELTWCEARRDLVLVNKK